jgi:phage repressor protein C with HTH and peptisase S24 domain
MIAEWVETDRGTILSNGAEYFPASVLAKLLHMSRAGVYKIAIREGWPVIHAPGRGAKDGVQYFRVPDKILLEINELSKKTTRYEQRSTRPLVSDDEKHNGLVLKDTGHGCQDSIYIEHYVDVRGAAGVGQVTPTDQMIISVAVNAVDWRNYVGLNPKHVKVISVYGDSMKPVLQHGDQVLVDTACNQFIDDAIYAIQQGDVLRIKRIKLKLDGSIEVKSDNDHGFGLETYSKEEAAGFTVFGRILPFKFGKFDL